ncbi:MAG: hypothetical protein AAF485_16860 [Chloroflexota bacterium]
MSVTIEVNGIQATIEDYQWSCEDEALLAVLNTFLLNNGPSGADPNPDKTVADEVVAALDGRLIEAEEMPYVKDRLY